jgi:hypothetical protein
VDLDELAVDGLGALADLDVLELELVRFVEEEEAT